MVTSIQGGGGGGGGATHHKVDVCSSGARLLRNVGISARTFSSTYSSSETYKRGMIDSTSGWLAKDREAGEWMQIDLGTPARVTGVVTQGYGSSSYNYWVTSYSVSTSLDGADGTFNDVDSGAIFTGNSDRSTRKEHNLTTTRWAQFVRFTVKTWSGYWIGMRAAVFVGLCDHVDTARMQLSAPVANIGTETTTSYKIDVRGLGWVVRNEPESARRYSSVYGVDNHGPGQNPFQKSMIDSVQAWSAGTPTVGDWMQIDLGAPVYVTGVMTQGRANYAQWVKSFSAKSSVDGSSFEDVDGGTIFAGNSDRSTQVQNNFTSVKLARFVRFIVKSFHAMAQHARCRHCRRAYDGFFRIILRRERMQRECNHGVAGGAAPSARGRVARGQRQRGVRRGFAPSA